MTTNQLARGRPLKPFLVKDDDRFAVALLHALMHVKKDGKKLAVWKASQLAALYHEYKMVSDETVVYTKSTAPSSSNRNSPKPKGLVDGKLRELTFVPNTGQKSENATARRLQSKYKKWVRSGTPEWIWLEHMAVAWMVALYPWAAFQQGLPPKVTCIRAARGAGEEVFAKTTLLPHLADALRQQRP
jgi:hypothetical protein